MNNDRQMYLRLQHWMPVIAMDVNSSASAATAERDADDESVSSSRPNSGTMMCWRDLCTTFVVNHQDPSYEQDDVYHKSPPHADKQPGSRFEHLLTEHFFAQLQTSAPLLSNNDQAEHLTEN